MLGRIPSAACRLPASQLWLQMLVAFRNESLQPRKDPLHLSKPCMCLLMINRSCPCNHFCSSRRNHCIVSTDRYIRIQTCKKQKIFLLYSVVCELCPFLLLQISELGIYPAVDPLDSRSRMLSPRILGQEHYNTALGVQRVLQSYKNLQDIIAILGMDELSEDDR